MGSEYHSLSSAESCRSLLVGMYLVLEGVMTCNEDYEENSVNQITLT